MTLTLTSSVPPEQLVRRIKWSSKKRLSGFLCVIIDITLAVMKFKTYHTAYTRSHPELANYTNIQLKNST